MRGQNLFSRLGRLLGLSPVPADVAEELSGLRAAAADLTQAQAENQSTVETLCEAVERLEKQIARAGKEQFKANALAEAQQQGFKDTLEQLREADAYRERELAHLRERVTAARADGRMEVINRLLPVLDGLGEALAAGERLLKDASAKNVETRYVASPPLRQRVTGAWALLMGAPLGRDAPRETPPVASVRHDALTAWLEGLEFVQGRLLDVLAAEGVRPIETEGESFDPHLHVAVEASPSADGVEPGRIVSETRRGYLVGDFVLRYAEVVVAR
ncbi:MAG: nucleotide exchange factor GrpE [Chloroflexi bacterium]|nr:nucleotide exchange factor GrpE [Chloroflexota bacterium]